MKPKIIKKAISIAKAICPETQSQGLRTSHVAFLIKKNKIIKIGWNKKRTHPQICKHPYHEGYVGIHAELDAVLKSGEDELHDHSMIVLRFDRKGKLNNSKPCPGCASVLSQVGITDIYYSGADGKIVKD